MFLVIQSLADIFTLLHRSVFFVHILGPKQTEVSLFGRCQHGSWFVETTNCL